MGKITKSGRRHSGRSAEWDKQSLTGHHPPEADAAGEDKQEDWDNPGDRLQLEGGEDSWTNSWCDLTVTSGHHGLGTSGFGSLGGIQARSLLSSSTVHQRVMSVARESLVEEGSWMRAHMRQAFTFSLKQRQGQGWAR